MKELVEKYIQNQNQEFIQEITNQINFGSASIVTLVEHLEPLLTNVDPFQRQRGISILVQVLQSSKITNQSATVLLEFFLSRLDDQLSVPDILHGILLLIDTITKTEQLMIPSRIFNELNVQSFPHQTRFLVFTIFEKLLHSNILKSISHEFILGFIHSMDGEKDPRNLMLLFKLVKEILSKLDYKQHTRDLFEVCFCYFPITFRPPPECTITPGDLKLALREVLTCEKEFGEFASQELVEKLKGTSRGVKFDVLETMIASLPVYGSQVYDFQVVWGLLKPELGTDLDLKVLEWLRTYIKISSMSVVKGLNPVEQVLSMVIKECLDNIQQDVITTGKVLVSCASANTTVCGYILDRVLLTLVKMATDEEGEKKRSAMNVVVDLVMASRLVAGGSIAKDGDEMDVDVEVPIARYKNEIMELVLTTMCGSNAVLKQVAIRGMYELITTPGLLNDEENKLVMEHFTNTILNEQGEITNQVLEVVKNLAVGQPALVGGTLQTLVGALQNGKVKVALEGLKSVSAGPLFSTVVGECFKQLKRYAFTSYDFDSGTLVLEYLVVMMQNCDTSTIAGMYPMLVEWLGDDKMFVYTLGDSRMLHCMGKVVAMVTRALDATTQAELLRTLVSKNGTQDGIPTNEKFAFLYQSVVVNLLPSTPLCFPVNVFLNGVVKMALESKHLMYLDAAGTMFGSVINKETNDNTIQLLFQTWEETYLRSAVHAQHLDLSTREFVVVIAGWVAKGLFCKGHNLGEVLLTQLLNLLEHPELAHAATMALEIVIKETVLTKQSFVIQKVLYKQKLYRFCYPVLVTKFEQLQGESKKFPLLVVSHLLSHKALVSDYDKIFPMLLFSLRFPDPTLKKSALNTFGLIIEDTPGLFAEHISTLIPLLLSLSRHDLGNDVYVRQAALKLLGQITKAVEYSILVPFIFEVMKGVGQALGDHKRICRKEAANTRGKWALLVSAAEH